MFSLNGAQPDVPVRPLRIIWFGGSIISDWDNPVATTNRAVIRSLQASGHDVLFFEPRQNAPFMNALKQRGSAIYRAFQAVYPDIHYRRYNLPKGSEGDVWLSRESALADAMIVQDDAPSHISDWMARIPPSPILKMLLVTASESPTDRSMWDQVLSPTADSPETAYGPAVLSDESDPTENRSGQLTVIYSGGARPSDTAGELVAAGSGAPAELPFVPEALLSKRYRQVFEVMIVDDDASPFAEARRMLAVASGATVTLSGHRSASNQPVEIRFQDASQHAQRLIEMISTARSKRLGSRM